MSTSVNWDLWAAEQRLSQPCPNALAYGRLARVGALAGVVPNTDPSPPSATGSRRQDGPVGTIPPTFRRGYVRAMVELRKGKITNSRRGCRALAAFTMFCAWRCGEPADPPIRCPTWPELGRHLRG